MALVSIKEANYTKAYSARGYLVVKYANDTTQTVYTDYNVSENSRSVAEVAYKLKQSSEYTTYTSAQQKIVDTFANAYVVAE